MKRTPIKKPQFKKCPECKVKKPIFSGKVCSVECAIEYTKKQNQKNWNKKKSEMRNELKTHSDWSHEIDVICQEIARLLDNGCNCTSCQKSPKKKNGGHRFSKQAEPQLRHNLLIIWLQCEACNSPEYRNGNPDGYDKGLEMYFGKEIKEEIHALRLLYKSNKKSIAELIQAKARARKIALTLKKADLTYTPEERIELRRKFNKKIGIYND